MKIIDVYNTFISNPSPSLFWKVIRVILHWLLIPVKLSLVLLLYVIMQVYMLLFYKKREINIELTDDKRIKYVTHIFKQLPIYTDHKIQLHTLRVPINENPDGSNHNPDHQLARHGVYSFLMKILNKHNHKISAATKNHIVSNDGKTLLVRGYTIDKLTENYIYNVNNTSGDQLIGLLLSLLVDNDTTLEYNYEKLINQIIDSDYALLNINNKKSLRGMWQPGIETMGAQSLTILAALKMGEKLGVSRARPTYNKLMYGYGYCLLNLFPTIFIPSKRGYFNDNNCITSAYILSKLSKNKLEKFYYNMIALYVWSLSYKWYNAYFTGLINDLMPNLISKQYIKDCENYLYEEFPNHFDKNIESTLQTREFPVKFNDMNQGEFFPDEEHKISKGEPNHRSGLGWLAAATSINTGLVKEILKNI